MKNEIKLGSCFLVVKSYEINFFKKIELKGDTLTVEVFEDGIYYLRASNTYSPCFGLKDYELNALIKNNTFKFLHIEDLSSPKYDYLRDNGLATVTVSISKHGMCEIKY